jgi:hypothetical protein
MQEFSFPWWFLLIEYAGGTSLAAYLRFTTYSRIRADRANLLDCFHLTADSTICQ